MLHSSRLLHCLSSSSASSSSASSSSSTRSSSSSSCRSSSSSRWCASACISTSTSTRSSVLLYHDILVLLNELQHLAMLCSHFFPRLQSSSSSLCLRLL